MRKDSFFILIFSFILVKQAKILVKRFISEISLVLKAFSTPFTLFSLQKALENHLFVIKKSFVVHSIMSEIDGDVRIIAAWKKKINPYLINHYQ